MLLADITYYFYRAPCRPALETPQKVGVRTGTPFSTYLRAFRANVVARTAEKVGPLAPSSEMAQQYPMLMLDLFVGDLTTRERSFDSLALIWTAFAE